MERRHPCALAPEGRPEPERLAEEGYFTVVEARWLAEWFERLAPAMSAPIRQRFLHGDMQATNVLVRNPSTQEYVALLDWGNAGWGDVALDFVGLPLRAVPLVLEGYREVATPGGDETIEARILYYHLWFALDGPSPAAAARVLLGGAAAGMLIEITRFLLESPGDRGAISLRQADRAGTPGLR